MRILYDIIISPLIFVYDILFTLIYRFFQEPVISIIVLSIVINFIVLPLYIKADALQKEEQAKKLSMSPYIKHIKKIFYGDEQFMMLQAFYRIEHYSPLSFLKESVPLLLQIPFFMAAYRFISSLSMLKGASFGSINDLLRPDGMLVIGRFPINVLPVLMTLINLFSGAVYSKTSTRRMKVQIFITSIIFLILLYDSPSGLVIYWTANNLFSLAKNIVFSLDDRRARCVEIALGAAFCIAMNVFVVYAKKQQIIRDITFFCSLLFILWFFGRKKVLDFLDRELPLKDDDKGRMSFGVVFVSELMLASLMGLYIPSTVLLSAVQEFMEKSAFRYELLTYPAAIYFGLFLLWFSVIYYSNGDRGRQIFSFVLLSYAVFSLLNQFVFSKSFGTLYTDLTFDKEVQFSIIQTIVNAETGLIVIVGSSLLLNRKRKLAIRITTLIAASLLVLGFYNVNIIIRNVGKMQPKEDTIVSYDGIFRLSRTGKNVIVLMLDRAIGNYVPYIFEEKPMLKETFQGFVLYPNTISFGTHTNFGAPALFGGYEYTPLEINKRDTERLVDKHNESLKMMPTLFLENGYDVTVCDPPLAGYQEVPDLTIYQDLEEIHTYNLKGEFSDSFVKALQDYRFEDIQKRNFLVYSLYRTAPLILRSFIYDNGNYIYNIPTVSLSDELVDSFSTLSQYKMLTKVEKNGKNCFLLLQNETPHNPVALNPPEYKVTSTNKVEETTHSDRILGNKIMKMSTSSQWNHYCINVATYIELGKWMDFLREEGVYDNTRILLVADHGYYLSQFPDLIHPDGLDIESLNPLLMVKDFDAHDPWRISMEFMTNADVPFLASKDLFENPLNPYTGKTISADSKKTQSMVVTDSNNWSVSDNNGFAFDIKDGHWWSVHNNIFDMNSWECVDEREGGK